MKKNIRINVTFQTYLCCLFILFLLLSRNTLYTSLYFSFNLSYLALIILSIPMIIKFFLDLIKKNKINKKYLKIIVIFDILLLLSILIKKDFALYNFTNLITINLAYIFSQLIEEKIFRKVFISTIIFLCITSLINLTVIRNIIISNGGFNSLKNTAFYIVKSSGTPFANFITSFVVWVPNYIRNFSIFTEPAFFQFYIISASILLYFSDYKYIFKVTGLLLFFITMISTFSTGGIIVFLILILYILYDLFFNKKTIKKVYLFISLIIIVLLFLLILECSEQVRNTLEMAIQKLFTKNDSSDTRFGSILYSINIFLSSPLFGNNIYTFLNEMNITNTLFSMFAIYGFMPGCFMSYFLYKFSANITLNTFTRIAIIIIIFLSITNHTFIGVQSFWLIFLTYVFYKGGNSNENTLVS